MQPPGRIGDATCPANSNSDSSAGTGTLCTSTRTQDDRMRRESSLPGPASAGIRSRLAPTPSADLSVAYSYTHCQAPLSISRAENPLGCIVAGTVNLISMRRERPLDSAIDARWRAGAGPTVSPARYGSTVFRQGWHRIEDFLSCSCKLPNWSVVSTLMAGSSLGPLIL